MSKISFPYFVIIRQVNQSSTSLKLEAGSTVSSISKSPATNSNHELASDTSTNNQKIYSVEENSTIEHAAVTLSFHHLNYTIDCKSQSNKRLCKCLPFQSFSSEEKKQVIKNISGKFQNGMNAILGEIIFTLYIYQEIILFDQVLLDVANRRCSTFWLIEKIHQVYQAIFSSTVCYDNHRLNTQLAMSFKTIYIVVR